MATPKNRNVTILAVAAVVLLVLAFVLSRGSADGSAAADGGPKGGALKPLNPKHAQAPIYPRDQKRVATPPPPEKRPALDAMQRALLPPDNKGAIFVEANAIRHAPLMEKILRCRGKDNGDGLDQMKDKLGIDPMEDVDRVGFDGEVFVASGFFSKMKVPAELGEGTPYGDGGRIWHAHDDKGQEVTFGKQGDGMLLTGIDEDHIKAAMDRAAGTAPADAAPSLPPGFGEGEVYGTVGADFLQSVLGDAKDPVAQSIAKLVTSSTVRMNVDEDAALSLDLQAVDAKSGADLQNALRGVFAGLHAKAIDEGDADLASLLEQARVSGGDGGRFNVDVAVPGETLLKGLGCKPDGTPLNPKAVKSPTHQ